MAKELPKELHLARIIEAYGGWRALIASKYFIIASLLMGPTYSQWANPGWWETVFSIVPNLLGFTIGAFALTIAYGDDRFKQLLATSVDNGDSSPLREMSATFLIFIAVQTIALIGALTCKGMWEFGNRLIPSEFLKAIEIAGLVLWAASYLLFIYGILLALAAARWIYMLAVVYTAHAKHRRSRS